MSPVAQPPADPRPTRSVRHLLGCLRRRPGAGRRTRLGTAPAHAANPRHPGQLHRLRLRPVRGADPEGDGPLAQPLPVPGGRHLHLRGLARLPHPAEPEPGLGAHPARPGAGGCCRSPWARRRPATPASRATGTTRRSTPDPGPGRHLPPRPQAGRRRGRHRRGRREGARHRRPGARCGTTSRASTRP